MHENIMFYNVIETHARPNEDTAALLHGLLHAEMKIPDDDMGKLRFDRIHRI